jgi:hypothetical protein
MSVCDTVCVCVRVCVCIIVLCVCACVVLYIRSASNTVYVSYAVSLLCTHIVQLICITIVCKCANTNGVILHKYIHVFVITKTS